MKGLPIRGFVLPSAFFEPLFPIVLPMPSGAVSANDWATIANITMSTKANDKTNLTIVTRKNKIQIELNWLTYAFDETQNWIDTQIGNFGRLLSQLNYHSDQCETNFIVGNVCWLNEANQTYVVIVFDE